MADDADAQPDAAAQWAQWSQMVQQQQQQQAGGGATAEGAQQTAQQQQMAYMYQQQMAMAQMMVRARGRVVWRRWSRAHGEGSVGDVSRCVLCAVHREVCAGGHHAFPVVGLQWAQRNTEEHRESWSFSPPLPVLPSRGPTICNPCFQHRKSSHGWHTPIIRVRAAPVSPPSTAYTWDLGTPLQPPRARSPPRPSFAAPVHPPFRPYISDHPPTTPRDPSPSPPSPDQQMAQDGGSGGGDDARKALPSSTMEEEPIYVNRRQYVIRREDALRESAVC